MGLAISLLALAVSAATPAGDPRTWLGSADFLEPSDGGSVGISYRLIISAEGVPVRCEFGHDNATKSFGTQVCTALMARARFTPARGSDGIATAGTFDGNVNLRGPGKSRWGQGVPELIDVELSVARLPAQIESPATALVAYAVSVEGQISDCAPFVPPVLFGHGRADERSIANLLGPVACRSALSMIKPKPALDAEGRPIASIQTSRIKFSTDKAPAR